MMNNTKIYRNKITLFITAAQLNSFVQSWQLKSNGVSSLSARLYNSHNLWQVRSRLRLARQERSGNLPVSSGFSTQTVFPRLQQVRYSVQNDSSIKDCLFIAVLSEVNTNNANMAMTVQDTGATGKSIFSFAHHHRKDFPCYQQQPYLTVLFRLPHCIAIAL